MSTWQRAARIIAFDLFALQSSLRSIIALALTAFSSSIGDDVHVLMLSSSYPLCNVSDNHLRPASQNDHRSATQPRYFPSHSQIGETRVVACTAAGGFLPLDALDGALAGAGRISDALVHNREEVVPFQHQVRV
ncbi:hypothetical protein EDB85DRAFT_2151396 [Lactarius pseudohatsudake]|nr:hypothetical protein EDB85DRAFT_2151396 [Lactarius pseudohatsudake]